MTPISPLRRAAAAGAAVAVVLLAGCQAAPVQPRTSVSCTPGKIAIEVTNVSNKAAKYTVTVEITRAGYTESEQYSSDRIAAGASGTVTDRIPDEKATCRVTGVEVFDA